jgi:hypothetical protein
MNTNLEEIIKQSEEMTQAFSIMRESLAKTEKAFLENHNTLKNKLTVTAALLLDNQKKAASHGQKLNEAITSFINFQNEMEKQVKALSEKMP